MANLGFVGLGSMGGRVAMRVAGDQAVVSVVGLAPWLPAEEPVDQLAHRRVLIAHGTLDMFTIPRASFRFAERAAAAGADVTFRAVPGERDSPDTASPLSFSSCGATLSVMSVCNPSRLTLTDASATVWARSCSPVIVTWLGVTDWLRMTYPSGS